MNILFKVLKDGERGQDTDAGAIMSIDESSGACEFEILPRAYVGAAEEGDRSAIEHSASAMADIVECDLLMPLDRPEPSIQDRYLLNWIVNALREIEKGTEPNVAFGWKQRNAKRGRKGPGILESMKRQIIASEIVLAMRSNQFESLEQAVAAIAEKYGVSEDMAWKHYSKWKDFPLWGTE